MRKLQNQRARSDWAAGLGLLLVSREGLLRCGHHMGHPHAFRRVSSWRVAEGVRTLSEHLYVFMEANETPRTGMEPAGGGRGRPRAVRARPPPRGKVKEKNEASTPQLGAGRPRRRQPKQAWKRRPRTSA